ncbi:MAG TPA: type II secretion system protein GspG [Thermoanaerobaculia bacterium]|nr:type II secretion system protein GspG [Thermoanaerobaculia bacterium]
MSTDPPSMRGPISPSGDTLTPAMIESLRRTKPWVRFLSVLGFIAAGFMVLAGLALAVIAMVSEGPEFPGIFGLIVGLLYFLLALLYIFPSLYLSRYATAIGRALRPGPKSSAVEEALGHQKSFWKFAGIMALVMLLLYIPGVMAAIAIPNLLTAMQKSKQKRTMADMRSIATALEAHAVDHNFYPATSSVDDLAALLEPTYIRTFPRVDGWENPFRHEARGCTGSRCQEYFLGSGGKDGAFSEESLQGYERRSGAIENFNDDIVYSNGSFLTYPAATQP